MAFIHGLQIIQISIGRMALTWEDDLVVIFLRVFFSVVLVSMLVVVFWASSEVSLWDTPKEVVGHPWFIVSLVDVYWGFLTFYCWVFYLERKAITKIAWLIGILLLGNIAVATYALMRLFKLPRNASAEDILLRPQPA